MQVVGRGKTVLDGISWNRNAAVRRHFEQAHCHDRIADLVFAAESERHRTV